jgi:hypothetical protein
MDDMNDTRIAAIEVLREAKKLVSGGFTKNTYARDSAGSLVDYNDATATCFCTYGALMRAAASRSGCYMEVARAVEEAWDEKYSDSSECLGIPEWNDSPKVTQSDVVDLFDCAISRISEKLPRQLTF